MELSELGTMVPSELVRIGCETLQRTICESSLEVSRFLRSSDKTFTDDIDVGGRRTRPILLRSGSISRPVCGVDTSSIDLGETEKGVLFAVRGCVVRRENSEYEYVRHGPFLFHISEKDRREFYRLLRKSYLNDADRTLAPGLEWMSSSVGGILERWLQRQIAETCEDSLLLWDGSMTAITMYNPGSFLSEMLKKAYANRNCILAFSKQTKLTSSDLPLSSLIRDEWVPCLVSVDQEVREQYGSRLRFLGRVYAAKLGAGPLSFRLDIDRRVPEGEGVDAVESLLASDKLVNGYPEALRLAHILSRFSASEVLAMQRYVAENYGLRIVPRLDIRQLLFGPYGGNTYSGMSVQDDGYL